MRERCDATGLDKSVNAENDPHYNPAKVNTYKDMLILQS